MDFPKFDGYDRPPYYEDDSTEFVNCDFCDDEQDKDNMYTGDDDEVLCEKCYIEYKKWFDQTGENLSFSEINQSYDDLKTRLYTERQNILRR